MRKHKALVTTTLFLLLALAFSACTSQPEQSKPTSEIFQDEEVISEGQETREVSNSASGPDADVIYVEAVFNGETWHFSVTVEHPDTGWEDYANGWDVVAPDGMVIKADPEDPFTRPLAHPHENEQPFTRSQSGLILPEGVNQVTVRAHDLVDGYGGQEITLDLTQSSGEGYQVILPGTGSN